MSEETKETINRFITSREKQLVEFDVVRMTQELKKTKTEDKEQQARCTMAVNKLIDGRKELEVEISLLKELLN